MKRRGCDYRKYKHPIVTIPPSKESEKERGQSTVNANIRGYCDLTPVFQESLSG